MGESSIVRIKADNIKFLMNYVCACGYTETGTTARTDYDGPLEGLISHMQRIRQTGTHMPVGWASYLGGVLKCPTCVAKDEEEHRKSKEKL